jgi:hypothetical protein
VIDVFLPSNCISDLGKLELNTDIEDSTSKFFSSSFDFLYRSSKEVFHGGGEEAKKLEILLLSAIKKRRYASVSC